MHRIGMVAGVLCALFAFGCAKKAVVKPESPKTTVQVMPPRFTPEQEADLKSILSGVVLHFDYDDATLKEEHLDQLRQVADALRVRPWAAIRIEGHCDERGTEEYNLALGQRRADAARKYLLALGVSPEAVEAITFGDMRPAVEGEGEDVWRWNRRDELVPAKDAFFDALAASE